MLEPIKVLFICSRNRRRSLTAEKLLEGAQPEAAEAEGNPAQALPGRVWLGWVGIRGADDLAQEHERRVLEVVFLQDRIERHIFAVMAELAALDVEWDRAQLDRLGGDSLGREKQELSLRVDELLNEPGAGDTVHLHIHAGDPFHGPLTLAAALRGGNGGTRTIGGRSASSGFWRRLRPQPHSSGGIGSQTYAQLRVAMNIQLPNEQELSALRQVHKYLYPDGDRDLAAFDSPDGSDGYLQWQVVACSAIPANSQHQCALATGESLRAWQSLEDGPRLNEDEDTRRRLAALADRNQTSV